MGVVVKMSDLLFEVTYLNRRNEKKKKEFIAKSKANAVTQALFDSDVIFVIEVEEIR